MNYPAKHLHHRQKVNVPVSRQEIWQTPFRVLAQGSVVMVNWGLVFVIVSLAHVEVAAKLIATSEGIAVILDPSCHTTCDLLIQATPEHVAGKVFSKPIHELNGKVEMVPLKASNRVTSSDLSNSPFKSSPQ